MMLENNTNTPLNQEEQKKKNVHVGLIILGVIILLLVISYLQGSSVING